MKSTDSLLLTKKTVSIIPQAHSKTFSVDLSVFHSPLSQKGSCRFPNSWDFSVVAHMKVVHRFLCFDFSDWFYPTKFDKLFGMRRFLV